MRYPVYAEDTQKICSYYLLASYIHILVYNVLLFIKSTQHSRALLVGQLFYKVYL